MIYELAWYKIPKIIYLSSPFWCQVAMNFLKWNIGVGEQVREQVRVQVWVQVCEQVREKLWAQMWDKVWSQVWLQVRQQVWAQVREQVRDEVRVQVQVQVKDKVRDKVRDQVWDKVQGQVQGQVRYKVWDQVWDQVRDKVRDKVRDQVWDKKLEFYPFSFYWNMHDYWRVSFYDYFQEIGIKLENEKYNIFKNMLEGWVYDMIQMENVCIVSALPEYIKRDEKNRMHSIDWPAVMFRDGYYLNYIHWVYFDYELFERFKNKELWIKEILNRENQDQKREMIMEIEYDKMLEEMWAEIIDSCIDGNGYIMNLYRVDLWDDEHPAVFYEAIDPSKKEKIVLRVHPTAVKTAMEGKLWTWKFLRDKYKAGYKINFIQET
jgi:hypothetical protein